MVVPQDDVIAWIDENARLLPGRRDEPRNGPLRLYPFQQAILNAMSEPDVKLVVRRPGRDADLPAVGTFHG
ncbi:hypothetical protein PQI07_16505 [Methylobacterium sp. 092160098-2]|uniref:hypothetical protein n=1 Tax=Methylobacterium sp. 092160098-2 TaxID=3025129 RepID=UPI002381BF85|nr:hypothetical protein [Methylobacterium sp. 092160098-2]MDE4912284.1 hypothetical protein [Methylobacterium sp. 092160098-2]